MWKRLIFEQLFIFWIKKKKHYNNCQVMKVKEKKGGGITKKGDILRTIWKWNNLTQMPIVKLIWPTMGEINIMALLVYSLTLINDNSQTVYSTPYSVVIDMIQYERRKLGWDTPFCTSGHFRERVTVWTVLVRLQQKWH